MREFASGCFCAIRLGRRELDSQQAKLQRMVRAYPIDIATRPSRYRFATGEADKFGKNCNVAILLKPGISPGELKKLFQGLYYLGAKHSGEFRLLRNKRDAEAHAFFKAFFGYRKFSHHFELQRRLNAALSAAKKQYLSVIPYADRETVWPKRLNRPQVGKEHFEQFKSTQFNLPQIAKLYDEICEQFEREYPFPDPPFHLASLLEYRPRRGVPTDFKDDNPSSWIWITADSEPQNPFTKTTLKRTSATSDTS